MRRALVLIALTTLAGCGAGDKPKTATDTTAATPTATATPRPTVAPLTSFKQCPTATGGYRCALLTVPLDRAQPDGAKLKLRVAVKGDASAPKGTVFMLTGGPGQGGEAFATGFTKRLAAAVRGYRVVWIDQRGTGNTALRCPALQQQVGSSDVTVPTTKAVDACAKALKGKLEHFTTQDTVEDLNDLRVALGADKIALVGFSYGTFVEERYAISYPPHVARMVAAGVVSHNAADGEFLSVLRQTTPALKSACGVCASDLPKAIAHGAEPRALFDTLIALSVEDARFPGVGAALHDAARGQMAKLDALEDEVHRAQAAPAQALSQGLHAATLCAETRFPWTDSNVADAERVRTVATEKFSPDELGPWPANVAADNGLVATCKHWPPTPPPDLRGYVPSVPVLFINGDRDLSTPLPDAQEEVKSWPQGELYVAHGYGHASTRSAAVRRKLAAYLQG